MKILITNDDGIDSPILSVLATALSRDHAVTVVAPAIDQSGMSQAFTHGTHRFLSYVPISNHPFPKYQVVGTPCDCVKFAISHLMVTQKFDLVLSGINLGENAGMSAVYSGTVAAAREAAMWGIPALAVSVWKNEPERLDFAVNWIENLLRPSHKLSIRPGGLWNINFPPCSPSQIEGSEFTAMSTVMFADSYESLTSEHGTEKFRLVGYKPTELFEKGTDDYALMQNRISITPLQVDQTDKEEITRLNLSEFIPN